MDKFDLSKAFADVKARQKHKKDNILTMPYTPVLSSSDIISLLTGVLRLAERHMESLEQKNRYLQAELEKRETAER